MEPKRCICGSSNYEETGYGLDFCLACGVGMRGSIQPENEYWTKDTIMPRQIYTRRKRFKKYFFRAMRRQSSNTIPQETWEYLLARGPFRSAKHIQRVLKSARNLKRKCYDSLPFLTAALCPHIKVPVLTEEERIRAFELFDRIDKAIVKGAFVSYLYCLEYILKKLGRQDVCEHINTIQCHKRRASYKIRLDNIFQSNGIPVLNYFRSRKSDENPEVPGLGRYGFYSKADDGLSESSVAPE